MKTIGNFFILISQLLLLSGVAVFLCSTLLHLVLQCTSISPDGLGPVTCAIYQSEVTDTVLSLAENYLFILYFALPLVALPLALIGTLLKHIALKINPGSVGTLSFSDALVGKLKSVLTPIIFVVISFALWFISIPILIYYIVKAGSLIQGTKNFYSLANPNRRKNDTPEQTPAATTGVERNNNNRRLLAVLSILAILVLLPLLLALFFRFTHEPLEPLRIIEPTKALL
jgi:hypothetical protein